MATRARASKEDMELIYALFEDRQGMREELAELPKRAKHLKTKIRDLTDTAIGVKFDLGTVTINRYYKKFKKEKGYDNG